MPDAKSLLPGRAFRSEHAQLRPEPHSIASHGPDPMDPLQTTRMRNGVLYAAEWPCCHDPLRLSLGSVDPFTPLARDRRAPAPPPPSRRGKARARVGARPGAARAPGPHPATSHPQANAHARPRLARASRTSVREPRARSAQARACVPWMAQPPRRPPSLLGGAPPGNLATAPHPRQFLSARAPVALHACVPRPRSAPSSLLSTLPLPLPTWPGTRARELLLVANPQTLIISPPFTRNQHTSRRAKERGRTPQLSLSAASACSSCVHAPRGPHHARVESNDLTPPEPPSLKPPSEYSPPKVSSFLGAVRDRLESSRSLLGRVGARRGTV